MGALHPEEWGALLHAGKARCGQEWGTRACVRGHGLQQGLWGCMCRRSGGNVGHSWVCRVHGMGGRAWGGLCVHRRSRARGVHGGVGVCARGIGHMGCMCMVHSCVCRRCGVLSWVGRVLRGAPPMWHGSSCRPRSLSPCAVRFCLSITAALQCPEVWGAAFQLWRGGCSSLGAASRYLRAGGPRGREAARIRAGSCPVPMAMREGGISVTETGSADVAQRLEHHA